MAKTLESPLDCKEIQRVHPKGDQFWTFIGRTNVEAGTPIFWSSDVKFWLIWKDSDVGKYWWQEEKGATEDEMVGWHHWLNGHEFGYTLEVGDRQAGLVCYGSWRQRAGHTHTQKTVGHDWVTELGSGIFFLSTFLWLILTETFEVNKRDHLLSCVFFISRFFFC